MNNMKQQLLDPLGTGCRIILLYFAQPNTKLRINNHIVQLTDNTIWETFFYRRYNYDSREDINVLFPMIIRYIELFLPQKMNKKNIKSIIKATESNDEIEVNFEQCRTHLENLAKYMIKGINVLQKTYIDGNVVHALQYYVLLLINAIENKYTRQLIAPHLIETLDDNLLDINKIKNMWTIESIVELSNEFDKCFNNQNETMLKASLNKIITILDKQDMTFNELIKASNSI